MVYRVCEFNKPTSFGFLALLEGSITRSRASFESFHSFLPFVSLETHPDIGRGASSCGLTRMVFCVGGVPVVRTGRIYDHRLCMQIFVDYSSVLSVHITHI